MSVLPQAGRLADNVNLEQPAIDSSEKSPIGISDNPAGGDRTGEGTPPLDDGSVFEIKAINHDNAREAEEVSQLFIRQYGKSFPLKDVYDPQFWCADRQWSASTDEIEQDIPFTSLVAMCGDRMVGHIAVRSCARSKQADIFLPVIDPDYRRNAIRLSFQFWRCLENLAHKQGWKRIVHYYCSLDPIFQIVAAKCFGSHEVAQIPMINHSAAGTGQPPVLTVLFNQIDSSHDLTTIYPPDEHLRTLEQIYRNLSIPREFSLDTSADERSAFRAVRRTVEESAADDSGNDPYEVLVNEALRLKQLRLRPAAIGGRDELKALLRAVQHRCETDQMSLMVLLPLEDRKTPLTAKTLTASGLQFSGILPDGLGGDQIIFSSCANPFSLDNGSRFAGESRSLEEISLPLNDARRAAR